MKKAVFQNLENRMVTGDPGQNRTGDLPLRSMAYHVIRGSDVTSNIIPYAE